MQQIIRKNGRYWDDWAIQELTINFKDDANINNMKDIFRAIMTAQTFSWESLSFLDINE